MTKKAEETVIVANPNNQWTLYGIIITLLVVIAIGWFFLWMNLWQNNAPLAYAPNGAEQAAPIAEDLTVTIYDDSRCTDCQTDVIVEQLKAVPVLANAEFVTVEFSESWVSEFLESNWVTALPAALFSTNWVWSELAQYLTPLASWEYSLALGASYNPFIERSDKGFLVAESALLDQIKATAHYKGAADAKITWIEYTDVNCHFCKKMETDGTANTVLAEFATTLNKATSNFIGTGWANTQKASEVLECGAKLAGADVYNTVLSTVLSEWNSSDAAIIDLFAEQGVDKTALQSCIDSGEVKSLVAEKFAIGTDEFGITGTPWNVIINNETGEYEIVSGAYPAEKFIETVNKLLGSS